MPMLAYTKVAGLIEVMVHQNVAQNYVCRNAIVIMYVHAGHFYITIANSSEVVDTFQNIMTIIKKGVGQLREPKL